MDLSCGGRLAASDNNCIWKYVNIYRERCLYVCMLCINVRTECLIVIWSNLFGCCRFVIAWSVCKSSAVDLCTVVDVQFIIVPFVFVISGVLTVGIIYNECFDGPRKRWRCWKCIVCHLWMAENLILIVFWYFYIVVSIIWTFFANINSIRTTVLSYYLSSMRMIFFVDYLCTFIKAANKTKTNSGHILNK